MSTKNTYFRRIATDCYKCCKHLHAECREISFELILEMKILKLNIIMMKNHTNFRFCRVAQMDFQRLASPRNVRVDLKYDVLCL